MTLSVCPCSPSTTCCVPPVALPRTHSTTRLCSLTLLAPCLRDPVPLPTRQLVSSSASSSPTLLQVPERRRFHPPPRHATRLPLPPAASILSSATHIAPCCHGDPHPSSSKPQAAATLASDRPNSSAFLPRTLTLLIGPQRSSRLTQKCGIFGMSVCRRTLRRRDIHTLDKAALSSYRRGQQLCKGQASQRRIVS